MLKILTSLKQLLPGFELNFQTKTFELNHLTITKEIWDYITYLVKLSCGEKVSQPLIFDSLEAEAFWKKQQEMDARIKKLKADKEGDPEGLIKNLMAITYSFPSFTIDYLYNQTMAQIHWLRELAAGEVSYRLQSQAAAAGNIKKGNKLNFFIKVSILEFIFWTLSSLLNIINGLLYKIANTLEWNESVHIKKAFFSKYKNSLGPVW